MERFRCRISSMSSLDFANYGRVEQSWLKKEHNENLQAFLYLISRHSFYLIERTLRWAGVCESLPYNELESDPSRWYTSFLPKNC